MLAVFITYLLPSLPTPDSRVGVLQQSAVGDRTISPGNLPALTLDDTENSLM